LAFLVPLSIDTVSSRRPTTSLYHLAKSRRDGHAKVLGMTTFGGGDTTTDGGDGSGGSGSGDGDTDDGSDGEGNLDLLQDEDGKSDGGDEDDDGRSDDGKSDSGDGRISFLGRRAKAGLVDKGRVGGKWTTNARAV
nr:hypothetical protein [Tanacetum cinerariifolium]